MFLSVLPGRCLSSSRRRLDRIRIVGGPTLIVLSVGLTLAGVTSSG